MTAITTQVEQLRKDQAMLAAQQLEFDKRLKAFKAPVASTGITKAQVEVIYETVRKALDQREEKILQSHGQVHRAAINEVKDQALAATLLGKSSFIDACDLLRGAVESILAGTGSRT
ncbi:hypothetical protein WKW77_30655 [Variovorax ureilyticus]|uniref:Uncharacterized protein n=1 Tax=Variovorax ureilyticus TaxID=1836198 RepID=A0ABU8VP82_9BURK